MQPPPSKASLALEVVALAILMYVIAANVSLFKDPRTSYSHGLMACLDMVGALICVHFYRQNPSLDRFRLLPFWTVALFGMGCQEAWFVLTHL